MRQQDENTVSSPHADQQKPKSNTLKPHIPFSTMIHEAHLGSWPGSNLPPAGVAFGLQMLTACSSKGCSSLLRLGPWTRMDH